MGAPWRRWGAEGGGVLGNVDAPVGPLTGGGICILNGSRPVQQ